MHGLHQNTVERTQYIQFNNCITKKMQPNIIHRNIGQKYDADAATGTAAAAAVIVFVVGSSAAAVAPIKRMCGVFFSTLCYRIEWNAYIIFRGMVRQAFPTPRRNYFHPSEQLMCSSVHLIPVEFIVHIGNYAKSAINTRDTDIFQAVYVEENDKTSLCRRIWPYWHDAQQQQHYPLQYQ